MLKNEQESLKRRMDDLNQLLQHKKQNCFQRNDTKPHFGIHEKRLNSSANEFTIYKKRQIRFVKPVHASNSLIMCSFCCQIGHMKSNCYVRKNMRNGMKCMWIVRHNTNSQGPKK